MSAFPGHAGRVRPLAPLALRSLARMRVCSWGPCHQKRTTNARGVHLTTSPHVDPAHETHSATSVARMRARSPVAIGTRIELHHPRSADAHEFCAAAAASRDLHGRWLAAPKDREAYGAYLDRL